MTVIGARIRADVCGVVAASDSVSDSSGSARDVPFRIVAAATALIVGAGVLAATGATADQWVRAGALGCAVFVIGFLGRATTRTATAQIVVAAPLGAIAGVAAAALG